MVVPAGGGDDGEGGVGPVFVVIGGGCEGEGGRRAIVFKIFFRETPFSLRSARFDFGGEFLAASEFRDGERVQPVDGFAVGEHGFQDMVQLAREAVFPRARGGRARGAEQALVGDGFEIFGVSIDEVVESAAWFRDGSLQLVPRGFDNFEEDVVLQLVDKVDHLGDGAPCGFPVAGNFIVNGGENAAGAGHAAAPGAAEGVFDAFDAPEELEDFEVLAARPRGYDYVDWGVNFVV